MAATQAEKQPNDVSNEKVQSDQHLNLRNSLLQNGTEKSSVRGSGSVVVTKAKASTMSQYRQDGGEQALGESEMGPTGETGLYQVVPASGTESPVVGDGNCYSFPFGNRDVHSSGDGSIHGFGPCHSFSGPKQLPGGFPQRFMTGQSISQPPTGPTPTLNKLLQSTSNPMQRFNSYGHPEQPYGQGWPPQKHNSSATPSSVPTGSYRNQSTLSPAYSGTPSSSPGYGESRTGWPGLPVSAHHSSGSPGPPSATAPSSQSSPQSNQQPSHSPGPGLPPSPQHQNQSSHQHQNFSNRPAQPTTPNAHAPDAADLSGGNSNDSSGGPAPGTPNSQGMRPTPSPTGSTGSRSMSPAVGQQNIPIPPRPSSSQSDGGGPTRMSHSPMATQSSYPPSHLQGYKGHTGMVPPSGQQMPIYQSGQQYTQSGFPPRPQSNTQYSPQGYGPPVSQAPPNSNMPPQQYPNRSVSNHMNNSQFSPYQQWLNPAVSTGNHLSGVKATPAPQAPNSPSPSTARPPHYLKQHLQHKMGFGSNSSPTPLSASPPQNFQMGPPPTSHHHTGMGPPPSMGPPNVPPATSPLLTNSHLHDGPMPPPSSTPNSHHQVNSDIMDNGITTTSASSMSTNVTSVSGNTVTSVVTTGPDGTTIDEGSQQSTLSNASAASGEDPQCVTPKSRKNDVGHYSHSTTPQSTVPSPGAASVNSLHDEYGELSSPSWPRTPASPKTDSLSKLYEMDDSPERRVWLDKLLAFMEERRTPITTCPTISKNPLDLFRLYVYVKERGGFMEVTKNKTWKDIAGMLGIGASSSAAYTLRKHYTKNLLAYECQFDRGGIDPQPIINQVEASSKKKGAKSASVPSPGSSNSQDSFPPPGSGGASMDGFNYGYPSGGNPDYNAQSQRTQSNAPSGHVGSGGANHLGSAPSGNPSPAGGASDNVSVSNPFDDVSPSPPPRGGSFPGGSHPPYPAGTPTRPQGQGYGGQGSYNQYPGSNAGGPADQYSPYPSSSSYPPAARTVYPTYSSDSSASPTSPNNSQGAPSAGQDPYNRYSLGGSAGGYSPRPTYGGSPAVGGPPASQPPSGQYPSQQDYYRPEQGVGGTSGNYSGGPPNKNMPPPAPHPRRHPDFAKDQQSYSQYGQQRPQIYGGWSNSNQYRGPYVGSSTPTAGSQQWNQSGRPSGQWDRYPAATQNYQPNQQGQQQWSPISSPGVGQNSPLRAPLSVRPGKPFNVMPPQSGKVQSSAPPTGTFGQSQIPKREITFPSDSIEATLPVLYRRKRVCRGDVGPVDAWRLIMCLRSGLLMESCYALDVLNILLFDDSSVAYFGLNQWAGLLDLLLDHFKKSLTDMFDKPFNANEKADDSEVDLGSVKMPIETDAKVILLKQTINYSHMSRKGHPVKLVDSCDDIFVQDHQKDWDKNGEVSYKSIFEEIITDPWHVTGDHILPTFCAEFCHVPFHRTLTSKRKSDLAQTDEETAARKGLSSSPKSPSETTPPYSKLSEKKRRTKSLSDVISRIKKDTSENAADVLVLENNKGNFIKTEVVSENANCDEQTSSSSSSNNVAENNEALNDYENDNDGNNKRTDTYLKIHDAAGTLKRRRISDYEDEAYTRDEASLVLITESQDNLGKRCVCISNCLRSLTFIPGNESEFAKSCVFLSLVGKLLLLHHEHPLRAHKTRNYDREEDADFADSCSSLQGENEWWWEFLLQIRENVLVSIANVAGHVDLSQYSEQVARPLLDGLLHWAICPSAHGQDPFASVGPSSLLSPQRLALEALCKLCVTNNNVDLVIATPPLPRLERLCAVLTKHLCRSEDQVLREFSINLLHYLAAADSRMARLIALQSPCISLLVAFIEQAEQSALGVANQHGIGALRDNPDSMGTSLDMLRRAAATLVFLARHQDNRPLLVQQEPRLLALVMSQILDQQVALLLSKVLYQISRNS
ncbi:trithorax group protein osa isoform X2 [Agrilus planipennis]|uniref:Trithorax group protein osa isoform X2 n=1 Tax=Agrilus planipennis TaxID=224129 RepID=A0A7F5RF14_AGRPL|nr:trithorax group protein osa isoform X2 [Agrilus planipennis]